MRKNKPKLSLRRQTLRELTTTHLRSVNGGEELFLRQPPPPPPPPLFVALPGTMSGGPPEEPDQAYKRG